MKYSDGTNIIQPERSCSDEEASPPYFRSFKFTESTRSSVQSTPNFSALATGSFHHPYPTSRLVVGSLNSTGL